MFLNKISCCQNFDVLIKLLFFSTLRRRDLYFMDLDMVAYFNKLNMIRLLYWLRGLCLIIIIFLSDALDSIS